MVVLLENSLIPAMILVRSFAPAQETVQCQIVSDCAAVKTGNVLLFILGNTRPGQKVSGLNSEGAVRRHSLQKAEL
jgi:hypothetical protein